MKAISFDVKIELLLLVIAAVVIIHSSGYSSFVSCCDR